MDFLYNNKNGLKRIQVNKADEFFKIFSDGFENDSLYFFMTSMGVICEWLEFEKSLSESERGNINFLLKECMYRNYTDDVEYDFDPENQLYVTWIDTMKRFMAFLEMNQYSFFGVPCSKDIALYNYGFRVMLINLPLDIVETRTGSFFMYETYRNIHPLKAWALVYQLKNNDINLGGLYRSLDLNMTYLERLYKKMNNFYENKLHFNRLNKNEEGDYIAYRTRYSRNYRSRLSFNISIYNIVDRSMTWVETRKGQEYWSDFHKKISKLFNNVFGDKDIKYISDPIVDEIIDYWIPENLYNEIIEKSNIHIKMSTDFMNINLQDIL